MTEPDYLDITVRVPATSIDKAWKALTRAARTSLAHLLCREDRAHRRLILTRDLDDAPLYEERP
jgi:hypothetical protein